MATRREVREAFYAELETAAGSLVNQITQNNPEVNENLPAIVHNDNYRRVPINRGVGPARVEEDSDGVRVLYYPVTMEGRFEVTIVAEDEQAKEDIYEAIRTHFEPFSNNLKDESTLQSDVHRVEVTDSTSVDQESREPIARGDRLSINVGYQRFYAKVRSDVDQSTVDATVVSTFEDMDSIDTQLDVGDDGTTDATYTTT